MNLKIRPVQEDDIESLVQLSFLAWEPVFESFENMLGPGIYPLIWPEWRTSQREAIEKVCREGKETQVWVAVSGTEPVGFLAYRLDTEKKTGTVLLLAVHPEAQNQGIGTQLTLFALDRMKVSGMNLAVVETGGDPAHAPARKVYEKAGYSAMPLVRYFQNL